MNKFKFDIKKNNLSWEKSSFKKCDSEKCLEGGQYRAPKSRMLLNDYFYFCLNHIKEYNKSWDFYKGMSVDQIENSMRSDTVWDRPSWPLKGNYKNVFDEFNEYVDDYIKNDENKLNENYFKNKLMDESLSLEESQAIKKLELKMPITLEKIKKNYKKLVKIFHPDVNGNNKNAEEKFKQINESYKILLKKFIKKNEKQSK
ncbi:MAG: DnaJ domain-containing protein [Pelagibacteraceae bacterium]|nr:DnaJ domain-containing protein [Pelagibacteraceae bacterium]